MSSAMKSVFFSILFLFMVNNANAVSPTPPQGNPASYQYGMKPFPPARPGYTRLTIHLRQLPNEQDVRVELMPGKNLLTDCNVSHFGGKLVRKTAQGWGFNYYEVTGISGPNQTRRACADNRKQQRFVPVYLGMSSIIPYNSKLPIVVYVPNGFNVMYRVLVPQTQGAANPE